MKKLIFCFSLICTGLLASCIDKNEEVDEDSLPSWLGSSIYDELETRSSGQLEGTFSTYLRLIDDLGYTETLSRTGSKTVFPANDEAFERFFSSDNEFGVTSYDELSVSQKKMLLYYSMLDNAILTSGLDNVNTGSSISDGGAIKHATTLSVIDTVANVTNPTELYPNNSYWRGFTSLYTVNDATTPMLPHFTREYFLSNDITTVGEESDFSILMGEEYDGTSTYVLRNKIVNADVTCQNGYIHQVEDVVVPPGNLAQMLKRRDDVTIISRMLDRFAYPYYDQSTTQDYNDWAMQNNEQSIDQIYDVRYLSSTTGATDDTNSGAASDEKLTFNPGWNAYSSSTTSTSSEAAIMSYAAMLVPDDDAMKEYFLNGAGAAIIQENAVDDVITEDNIMENIDSIPRNLVASILNNLMKTSFATTVPSKFATVTNDVYELMGLTIDDVKKKDDGSYDIGIANNAVAYYLNTVMAPVTLSAVSGVARIKNNMRVMRWAITDESTNNLLMLDYYAYLQAIDGRFGLFLPSDAAFDASDFYYLDVATLGRANTSTSDCTEAIHYYYTTTTTIVNNVETEVSSLNASRWRVDPNTFEVIDSIPAALLFSTSSNTTNIARVRAHFQDILNYHTIVFNSSDNSSSTFTTNKYYKTKHGGEVYVEGTSVGDRVMSGGQINSGLPASVIENVWSQDNGTTFQIDHVIQGPTESVYKVLGNNDQFSEFYEFCQGFNNTEIMEFAGISSVIESGQSQAPIDRYIVFDANDSYCLDYNINFFNSYNYTVYAPNNTAMEEAYSHGLPEWEKIDSWYTSGSRIEDAGGDATIYKDSIKSNLDRMRDFVRLHFQRSSIYVDNEGSGTSSYSTFLSDDLGISQTLSVTQGSGQIVVTDLSDLAHTITDGGSRMVNRMARDFTLSDVRTSTDVGLYFTTSSFAVIHEIDQPLYYNTEQSYFTTFSDSSSSSSAKAHKLKNRR